jgi:ribonuclease-3 family protein
MDLFSISLSDEEIGRMSNLALAHIGDAVYELLVRSWLCREGAETAKILHVATIRYVAAPAQAEAAHRIDSALTDEEKTVYRRGRNARVNSVPGRSSIEEYHSATGLEALFGWLFLKGKTDRLSELFTLITEGGNNAS